MVGSCRVKVAEEEEEEEDFGFADLSIGVSKRESMTGLLHQILDSASEPDEERGDGRIGLERRLQRMGFDGDGCWLRGLVGRTTRCD